MKPLLIAQSMTDIDERFILGSMPPSVIPSPKPARPKLKAGVIALSAVAAVLSGVLTVGLIVSLVKMGTPSRPPTTPRKAPPPPKAPRPKAKPRTRPTPSLPLSIPRDWNLSWIPTDTTTF